MLIAIFAFESVLAQNTSHKTFGEDKDVFGSRNFIENKGQFDKEIKSADKVFFALINGKERIYFTKKGIIHQLIKEYPLTADQREELAEGKKIKQRESDIYEISMTWEGSTSDLQIIGEEKQSNYFTYGKADFNSYTYKKIVYKNVYKNIDFVYSIPLNKTQGIKYDVLIHPGGDADNIKMLYSGDLQKIKKDKEGNVVIKTPLDDLIEYAPKSFYQDRTTVESSFLLEKNVLGFSFKNGYKNNQTLIIDPWVTAITTMSACNFAYDVDYDNSGNVYIYGGNPPCKLAKYSPSGVLIWTFSGTIIAPSWVSSVSGYAGNFVVIKTNGKTYLGQPINVNGTQIVRLDASGNYDNLISPGVPSWREAWDMAYHCSTGNVYGMGGSTQSNESAGILNQLTGSLTPIAFFNVPTASTSHDIVSYAIDDTGEFFWIYGSGYPAINNRIARINAAFTSSVWIAPSTFSVLQEAANHNQYTSGAAGSNAFNCLAVNQNYLYYYDGLNLAAYNKLNGSIIASTIIAGQSVKKQGGIAVDDCNNLYLGGNGNLLSYNFNGTSFTALPSIPLAVNTNTQYVYDVKLDKFNKILYVTGTGFVSTYQASNSNNCNPLAILCYNPLPVDHVICAGTSVTITAYNYFNFNNPTYSLQPGGITNNTGTFVVTPLSNVSYTAYVVGTNTNGISTLTTVTNVTVNVQPNASPTTTQSTCTSTVNAFNLGLSFNPPGSPPNYTITWSSIPNGVTSPTQTSLNGTLTPIAPGGYTATIVTSAGCSTVVSFTINPQPGPPNFTINPPGGVYVINCYQPTLNLNILPVTNNYTWTNGVSAPVIGTTAAFTSTNSFGTWTCHAINPVSGCVSSQTFVINQNTVNPTSIISPTFQNITCSLTSVTSVTGIVTPTVNVTQLWLSPLGGSLSIVNSSFSYFPGGPGTYTHITLNTVNGCTAIKTFTVASSSGFPIFTVVSPQNFTLGCGTKSIALININNAQTTPSGSPTSYTLLGPTTASNIPAGGNLGNQVTYSVNIPGTWTVITRDNSNSCDTRVALSVLQNTIAPDIAINALTQILTCDIPSLTLEGVSTNSNTNYNWSLIAQSGGNVSVQSNTLTVSANTLAITNTLTGNYTLTIRDNNNTCASSSVIVINQNLFAPKALISGEKQITCATPTVLLTNSSSTGIPPIFNPILPPVGYIWYGPSPQLPVNFSSTYLGFMPGTYTMVVKDLNNGCTSVAIKVIDDGRDYPTVNRPAPPEPFILDCGYSVTTIQANVANAAGLTYSWVPPIGAETSDKKLASLKTNALGQHMVIVTNSLNGCESIGFVDVIQGTLKAEIIPDQIYGYAPLTVNFLNNSKSTRDTTKNIVTTTWSFGNGISLVTKSSSISPSTVYDLAGTYTVTAIVNKGECQDRTVKVINVEIPSSLEIPNVFTPNGDGINDLFFVKAANLSQIKISILDRWGHKVYDIVSEKGNIAWDGKNQFGKDVADGVYLYVITAKGYDDKVFEQKGSVTVAR